MKFLPIVAVVTTVLAAGGCATKSYVRKSIDPVNGKVDQQTAALNETNGSLKNTQQTLESDETKLSATTETAKAADSRASDALNRAGDAANKATDASNKADQASAKADQFNKDLNGKIASIDDYKKVSSATVNFKFDSDKLDPDARQQLDQMATDGSKYKRYFVAVEGFTDTVGDKAYNAALSRRRADAVMTYLVSEHDIPVYRIQMIGLGEVKPVDDAKTKAARAKNRRVEVTIYSADDAISAGPMARN